MFRITISPERFNFQFASTELDYRTTVWLDARTHKLTAVCTSHDAKPSDLEIPIYASDLPPSLEVLRADALELYLFYGVMATVEQAPLWMRVGMRMRVEISGVKSFRAAERDRVRAELQRGLKYLFGTRLIFVD